MLWSKFFKVRSSFAKGLMAVSILSHSDDRQNIAWTISNIYSEAAKLQTVPYLKHLFQDFLSNPSWAISIYLTSNPRDTEMYRTRS